MSSTSPQSPQPTTAMDNDNLDNDGLKRSGLKRSDSKESGSEKKSWADAIKSYLDPRAIIILFLGFSAGVPILLIFNSLSLWLSEAGVSKSIVTMFSWAALGYSFKFIWAPLIDAIPVPILSKWLGLRRAWMLVAQLSVICAIILMATTNPVHKETAFTFLGSDFSILSIMAMGAVWLGFSSATQDIVIDAYRIELAPNDSSVQSVLSAMYSTGYRLGMIVSGAGALYLADFFGSTKEVYNYEAWRNTYLIMAGVMGVGVLTTFTIYEPKTKSLQPKKLARNQKIMTMYAGISLMPVAVIGLIYLVSMLLLKVFGSDGLHSSIAVTFPFLNKYVLLMAMAMPVALIYLLIQQPNFEITEHRKFDSSASDKARLFTVFVMVVVLFIVAYKFSGKWRPVDAGIAEMMVHGFKLLTVGCYAIVTISILKILRHQIKSSTFNVLAFFAVIGIIFMLVFKNIGDILPVLNSKEKDLTYLLISVSKAMSHLLTSLSFAIVMGFSLVKAGVVKSEVAEKTWIDPIADFFRRYGLQALLLLALIGLYRISDIVASIIGNLFYEDMGFTKTDIATAVKLVGVLVAIIGGFLGGILAQRMKIMRAMMVGAILACTTNLMFVVMTHYPGELPMLYVAVAMDNLASGLTSAVFIAFLSALTSIRFTAVQYAIFSSIMTLLPKVLGGYSGMIVENMSYSFFFTFCCLIGVPILGLVYLVDKYIHIGEPLIGDK